MAIGSVEELVDYREQTIAIAKKYGGGGGSGTVDLGLIADNYDPDRTTSYPVNDMVVEDGKLYRATSETKASAGTFDPTMWSKFDDYDSTQTYNTDQIVVYEGTPYRCTENGVTGDWDATKWADMSSYFTEYDETSTSYYSYGSMVEYDGDFYRSTTFTPTGAVGEFNTSNWTETTVEEVINNQKVKIAQICSNSDLATDENGFVTNALTLPQDLGDIVSVQTAGNMLALGRTFLIQYFYGIVNGNHTFKIRLLNTDGSPLASKSAGEFADAGVITISYLRY